MGNKIADFFGITKKSLIYAMLILVFMGSLFLSVSVVESFVEYSSLPVGLTKALMGIILWKLIDDTIFGSIDTNESIMKNNISYAVIQLGSAIIIALCVSLS